MSPKKTPGKFQMADYSQYNDKASCEAAGGVWDNNTCKAPGAAMSELIAAIRKLQEGGEAKDYSQYGDQSSCEAAGGHWYDGACHAEPQPGVGASRKFSQGDQEMYKQLRETSSALKTYQTQLANLQKELFSTRVEASKQKAEAIWTTNLNKSSIDTRFWRKIRGAVNAMDYVDSEGKLDHVRFAKEVNREISDWAVITEVSGTGLNRKTPASNAPVSDDQIVDDLLSFVN